MKPVYVKKSADGNSELNVALAFFAFNVLVFCVQLFSVPDEDTLVQVAKSTATTEVKAHIENNLKGEMLTAAYVEATTNLSNSCTSIVQDYRGVAAAECVKVHCTKIRFTREDRDKCIWCCTAGEGCRSSRFRPRLNAE
jgi:hypothetical protein